MATVEMVGEVDVRFPLLADTRRAIRNVVEPIVRFVAVIMGSSMGGRGSLGAYHVVAFPLRGSDQQQVWSRLSDDDWWKRLTGVRCAVAQPVAGRFVIEPHTGGQLVIESSVFVRPSDTSIIALPQAGIALIGVSRAPGARA